MFPYNGFLQWFTFILSYQETCFISSLALMLFPDKALMCLTLAKIFAVDLEILFKTLNFNNGRLIYVISHLCSYLMGTMGQQPLYMPKKISCRMSWVLFLLILAEMSGLLHCLELWWQDLSKRIKISKKEVWVFSSSSSGNMVLQFGVYNENQWVNSVHSEEVISDAPVDFLLWINWTPNCPDSSPSVLHPCRRDVGVGSILDLVNQLWVLWSKLTEKFRDRYNDFLISVIKAKSKVMLNKIEYLVYRNFFVSPFPYITFWEFPLNQHFLLKIPCKFST